MNGTLKKYEARTIAKGSSQQDMVKITLVLALNVISMEYLQKIYLLTVSLNWNFEEDVYMW